jgi:hypothetical protein
VGRDTRSHEFLAWYGNEYVTTLVRGMAIVLNVGRHHGYHAESDTEAWWEEMLVQWFDVPEEEKPAEEDSQSENSDSSPPIKTKT